MRSFYHKMRHISCLAAGLHRDPGEAHSASQFSDSIQLMLVRRLGARKRQKRGREERRVEETLVIQDLWVCKLIT